MDDFKEIYKNLNTSKVDSEYLDEDTKQLIYKELRNIKKHLNNLEFLKAACNNAADMCVATINKYSDSEEDLEKRKGYEELLNIFKNAYETITATEENKKAYKDLITLVTQPKKQRGARLCLDKLGLDMVSMRMLTIVLESDYLAYVKKYDYRTSKIIQSVNDQKTYKEYESLIEEILEKEDTRVTFISFQIITRNVLLLQTVGLQKQKEENEEKERIKFEYLPLELDYSNARKLTITETALFNEIGQTKLNSQLLKDLEILKNNVFEIDVKSIEDSTQKVESLTELDRFVLNTIVVDLYYKNGVMQFTDRQIAALRDQENGHKWVSEETRKDVNDSINKLRNTYITLNYKSVEDSKKGKFEQGGTNPLLLLENRYVKGDTTSNYYDLKFTPYLDYLLETKSPMIEYGREFLFKKIEGINKTTDDQNLRLFLLRRVKLIEETGKEDYIDVEDIYRIKNVIKDLYKTDTAFRKAKQYANAKTLILLKELKEEIKKDGNRLGYSQDNIGRAIKGYKISVKKLNSEK